MKKRRGWPRARLNTPVMRATVATQVHCEAHVSGAPCAQMWTSAGSATLGSTSFMMKPMSSSASCSIQRPGKGTIAPQRRAVDSWPLGSAGRGNVRMSSWRAAEDGAGTRGLGTKHIVVLLAQTADSTGHVAREDFGQRKFQTRSAVSPRVGQTTRAT